MTELRLLLVYLYRTAVVFLFAFLGGALAGTFVAGCNTIANLAPGH